MPADDLNVLETIVLEEGLEIDKDEGWRKVIERQFGGDPGRGSAELLQNAVDSYPPNTPWEERWVVIQTGPFTLSMTDYGEGMPPDRLTLLLTLGGTDKGDPDHIGRFGIGFFSIFSPALGTKQVRVITRCEGHVVEIVFDVEDPHRRPKITARRINREIDFRTRVEVTFGKSCSVDRCMNAMQPYLKYYPCRMTVNGTQNKSIWDDAKRRGLAFFKQGNCDGYLDMGCDYGSVNVLCKYEYVTGLSFAGLITGGHNMTYDLQDYFRKSIPYLPNVAGTVNCSQLDLTISRDGFYLNWAYDNMVRSLGQVLMVHLDAVLKADPDPQLILANQYVLCSFVKVYIDQVLSGKTAEIENSAEMSVARSLAEAKVYRLNGKRERFSLLDLAMMRSPNTPLFYSDRQRNLRWLGGAYKHDFVVLPKRCTLLDGAPGFYDTLFGYIFVDIVNLDTIAGNNERIRKLVERGIIDKKALMPECTVIGDRQITRNEAMLLREIDAVLAHPEVRKAIARNLHLGIGRIRSVLFDVQEQGVTIATGVFDENGRAVGENEQAGKPAGAQADGDGRIGSLTDVEDDSGRLLGLRRDHPFVMHLIESEDPYRAYYGLTFLAHELALCQKRLVPYSPFFHLLKEQLAADMRRALMMQLIGERGEESKAA